MCSAIRRFVHLIADDLKGSYTLRRIDTTPLFAGVNGKDSGMRRAQLPRPVICFDAPDKYNKKKAEFFLLGSKIVSVNMNRRTIFYDTSNSSIGVGPDLRQSKSAEPAWATVQGKLYLVRAHSAVDLPEGNIRDRWDYGSDPLQSSPILPAGNGGTELGLDGFADDDYPKPCFEALRFDERLKDWFWDLLPSPPFMGMPFECHSATRSSGADGKTIWMSTEGKGTYTFDTMTSTWSKEGDWALPFDGQFQYISEYDQYFGFSQGSNSLICSDQLMVGANTPEPPMHGVLWDDLDGSTGCAKWSLARSYLTYLGGGRFCVTRFYDTRPDCFYQLCDVAVMTPVEVKRASSSGELQMVKVGACRCYKFSEGTLSGWAL